MTYRDVLLRLHNSTCNVAQSEINDGYMEKPYLYDIVQETILFSFVLGEVIDSLPEEIANKEV